MRALVPRSTEWFAALASLGLLFQTSWAATVVLQSVADTTLVETATTNNLGGACFFNAGTTGLGTRNRGLMRFNLASFIPRGSTITSVTLTLQVTGQPETGDRPSLFGLHRVLKSWGEGTKGVPICPPESFQSPGLGEPAEAGEATWIHRFAFTSQTWSVPGGARGTDFSTNISAATFVFAAGDPISFETSPALAADVQFWLDNPETNFGWMLISDSEGVPKTARRFGSREDPGNVPYLVVEFVAPPRFERVQRSENQIQLFFTAQPGRTNGVEFCDTLGSGGWSTLTNFPPVSAATNHVAVDLIARPQRFYRLVLR